MAEAAPVEIVRQHLIDPEICIRCNTCEETCPVDAISHDSRNYIVDAAKCNFCNDCISPCPTGAIDNWRQVDEGQALHPRRAAWLGLAAGAGATRRCFGDIGNAHRRRADHVDGHGRTGR